MDKKGKIGIALVGYNDGKYIEECINSLKSQTVQDFEIIYWDNASKDDSLEILQNYFPEIEVIKSNENVGFAKANNELIYNFLERGVEYILLLNVDTYSEENLLEWLLKYADCNTLTTVRITFDREHQKRWYAGGELLLRSGGARHLSLEVDSPQEVSFISGCCVLIHRSIIERYGYFDDQYYLYYEDTDWMMNAYINGVKMIYIPEPLLTHVVGGSGNGIVYPRKEYYITRNRLLFVKKYQKYIQTKTKTIIWEMIKDCITNKKKTKQLRIAKLMGIIDYCRKSRGKISTFALKMMKETE